MEGNEYARTRDIIELSYIAEAIRQGKPVLGICRGSQILAVALGGRLLQDIPTAHPEIGNRHFMSKELDRSEGHSIRIPVDSAFARILKLSSNEHSRDVLRSGSDYVIAVNSYHHQSVLDEFPEIQVQARDNVSTKGVLKPVIEGFLARSTSALVMGVQFHPERPFAQNSQTIDAVNTSRKDWQVWFDSDKRRPYYRHIFENFVACAKKDTKKCQR
jgi:putative glutamine amidotransferase